MENLKLIKNCEKRTKFAQIREKIQGRQQRSRE